MTNLCSLALKVAWRQVQQRQAGCCVTVPCFEAPLMGARRGAAVAARHACQLPGWYPLRCGSPPS